MSNTPLARLTAERAPGLKVRARIIALTFGRARIVVDHATRPLSLEDEFW